MCFFVHKANFAALLKNAPPPPTPHPLTLSPLAACSDCCSVIKFLGCGLALGPRVCAGSTHYGGLIGICSAFCFGFVNKQRRRCQFLAGGGQTPGAALLACRRHCRPAWKEPWLYRQLHRSAAFELRIEQEFSQIKSCSHVRMDLP